MCIKEVAVIGAGGLSGLAAVYELLHTDQDGNTTIGKGKAETPAFTKIVGFEQKPDVGGTWNVENYESDPPMPPQEILDTGKYNDIKVIRPKNKHQPTVQELENTSVDSPIIKSKDLTYLQWKRSAIYPRLYTNTPESYLQYSTTKTYKDAHKDLDPFVPHQSLFQRLQDFSNENKLKDYIRFNTEVVDATKVGDKWVLTLRAYNETQDFWYQESFDGVIVAQGLFSVPFIPFYKGLSEYVAKYPGSVMHSKAYRDPKTFQDKKVVIVGSNISAIDIGQYVSPIAKETIISRNLENEPYLPYMARSIKSFQNVSKIKEFLADTKQIVLEDGEVLSDVDNVILCTGYHVKSLIFDDNTLEFSIPVDNDCSSSNSRVKNIYQHTFNIKDPSVAFVGRLVIASIFKAAEAESAAIAGVWSGASKLPPVEEQYAWEQARVKEAGDSLFHKDDIYRIKEKFFDEMKQFYPKGRPDPIGHDLDDMKVYERALETFESLFNEFKEKKKDVYYSFTEVSK